MADTVLANTPNSADINRSIRGAAMAPVYGTIADISGANADYVASPSKGVIVALRCVVSGDPGAATVITVSNETKSRTIGTVTIANSSTAGDATTDVDISVTAGEVGDGDVIKALSDAAATNAVSVNFMAEINRAQE